MESHYDLARHELQCSSCYGKLRKFLLSFFRLLVDNLAPRLPPPLPLWAVLQSTKDLRGVSVQILVFSTVGPSISRGSKYELNVFSDFSGKWECSFLFDLNLGIWVGERLGGKAKQMWSYLLWFLSLKSWIPSSFHMLSVTLQCLSTVAFYTSFTVCNCLGRRITLVTSYFTITLGT